VMMVVVVCWGSDVGVLGGETVAGGLLHNTGVFLLRATTGHLSMGMQV
jgi:hypothetical protein